MEGDNISAEKPLRLNEQINVPEVRLISAEGEQLGIVKIMEALRNAEQAGLDLVEISPNAEPPVCRVMDYGKHIYRQSKQKKKQATVHLKEVKFRVGTEDADIQVKVRNIRRFLEQGDKVKVSLRYRGREMAHQELGLVLLQRIEASLAEMTATEQKPRLEGRQIVMVLAPKKK